MIPRALALALLLLAPLLTVPAAASEAIAPHWDHLPAIGYQGEDLVFSWRAEDGSWSVAHGADRLDVQSGDDGRSRSVAVRIEDADSARDDVVFTRAAQSARVRLIRPGGGRQLAIDADCRHLLSAGTPAVLVLPRIESEADRRWGLLAALSTSESVTCEVVLREPAEDNGSGSGILGLIATAQSVDVAKRSVLILAAGSDGRVGWTHRAYRQCVAWLVADLECRAAAHVVLAGPIGPRADYANLAPLQRQVIDVANAYHCRLLDLSSMADDAHWQLAPGILGPRLNPSGEAALAALLRPWRSRAASTRE
ncbi:MAG: hypothetical protein H0W83_09140 [Planctomycetes bacterium]|nr:hypothetical protein [Planctomycetota bacterium]